jgi:hypothetical protein
MCVLNHGISKMLHFILARVVFLCFRSNEREKHKQAKCLKVLCGSLFDVLIPAGWMLRTALVVPRI